MSDRVVALSRTTAAPSPAAPTSAAPRPMAARTRMLLEAPILPTLLTLAAPNVLNLLAIAGMITFDGLFLGRLGAEALAGVSLAFPFVMLIQHTAASGMGGGVTSAIARALGSGRRDVADALVLHTLVLALALGAAFSAVLLAGAPTIFRWMGGQGPVLQAALDYAGVAFAGAVSICLLNLLGSAVRGTGNMGLPAGVIVGSVLGHVAISPLLIFGWGPVPALGPAGAGWGLMCSFGVGSLVLLAHLRSPRALVRLRVRGVALRWQLFADILKVGVPGLVNVGITNLAVVLLTGIAGHLGTEVAIGYAMGARLEYILIPLAFGFGTAIVALVGTNRGAQQHARARAIAWTGGAVVGAACAAIGGAVALLPDAWMGLFTRDPAIIAVGAAYLGIVGPIYGLYGVGMALYFATQGFGSVVWAVGANAVRLLVSAGGALAAVVWLDLGATGFFVAIAAGFTAYAALTCGAVVRAHRRAGAALAVMVMLAGALPANAAELCWPRLDVREVAFTAPQPLERTWHGVVAVDAARCAAGATGRFEVGFLRHKENAPEAEFRERFTWAAPSVPIAVTFWADEWPGVYWLDNVQPCPCVR